MGNEIVPSEASSWSDVLQELNFPKIILGPAGEAISRLVGHVADLPTEYVKSFTQVIQDKREARSEVSKALSKAVAAEVSNDRELIQRAAQSFLAKELRAQTNKEAVAKKAIEHLPNNPDSTESNPETPDEDWLNIFERYAENASSEKLRDLWGRILAKQIRKPKSFSLRTMRFVSELDAETARIFEKYSIDIINGEFMLKPQPFQGQIFIELLQLEDTGLLTGVNGDISQIYKNDSPSVLLFRFPKSAVLVRCDGAFDFNLRTIMLTNVGKELLKIVDPTDSLETVRTFAENFPKGAGITSVKYGKLNDERNGILDAVTAWEMPPPEPAATQ
jgi:hypothetical protein